METITITERYPKKIVVTSYDKSWFDSYPSNTTITVLSFVLLVVTVLILSFMLKYAWNKTIPHIFGIREISYVEAMLMGLIVNLLIKDDYVNMYNNFLNI